MRHGPDLIGHRRRFVTTAQNRVVQVGRVRFSGVKRYNNPLTLCIYPDVAYSGDAHERFAQFADAFIAILAFRGDGDSLQHRLICTLQVVRIGRIEMMRIEWFNHPSIYASGRAALVLVLKHLVRQSRRHKVDLSGANAFVSFRAQSRSL
jgi:hypothetical protein